MSKIVGFECNSCGREFENPASVCDPDSDYFNQYCCPYCDSIHINPEYDGLEFRAEQYFDKQYVQTLDFAYTEAAIIEEYQKQLEEIEACLKNRITPPEEQPRDYTLDLQIKKMEVNDNRVTIGFEIKTGKYNSSSQTVEVKTENREFEIKFDEDEEIISMDWDENINEIYKERLLVVSSNHA